MKFKLTFIFILAISTAFSQGSFSHAVGIAGFFGTRNASSQSIGVTYSPRYNFLSFGESSTLSVGTHLGLAFSLNNRDVSNFTYHVPIVFEYNFGHASSTSNSEKKSGGFIGVGYSFESTHVTRYLGYGFGSITTEETIQGPMANVGMRFKIAKESFGMRLSYLYGTGNLEGGYMVSFGFQYNFGMN